MCRLGLPQTGSGGGLTPSRAVHIHHRSPLISELLVHFMKANDAGASALLHRTPGMWAERRRAAESHGGMELLCQESIRTVPIYLPKEKVQQTLKDASNLQPLLKHAVAQLLFAILLIHVRVILSVFLLQTTRGPSYFIISRRY